VDPTDQHNTLKLFGQLLGPAAKRGEGALREDLEQQRGEGQRKMVQFQEGFWQFGAF
jgi:hypothetical protein